MPEATFKSAIAGALALIPEGPDTVVIDGGDEAGDVTTLIATAQQSGSSWVVEIPQVGSMLEALSKQENLSVFYIEALPGSLFVTCEPLAAGRSSVIMSKGVIGYTAPEPPPEIKPGHEPTHKRITKLLKTAEERYVLGVVLVPEHKDSQGDIYSHDEVRNAAHVYMEKAQALGKQHGEIVTGKLKILESYVAPVDFVLEAETITKGTWILGIRVVDDDLWTEVKKGSFTGFSIGGEAYRTPETPAARG